MAQSRRRKCSYNALLKFLALTGLAFVLSVPIAGIAQAGFGESVEPSKAPASWVLAQSSDGQTDPSNAPPAGDAAAPDVEGRQGNAPEAREDGGHDFDDGGSAGPGCPYRERNLELIV